MSYVNVNSIRNKFSNLREIMKENVDVLAVASAQIFLEEYLSPSRLDSLIKNGGLLVCVKATRQLYLAKFQFIMQSLPFELNLRKETWSVILIYTSLLDSL